MRVDLSSQLNEGVSNLLKWRNRYSKNEYPEKILLNLFYRKYGMVQIWDDIDGAFKKKLFGGNKIFWNNYLEGFSKLKALHQETARAKVMPVLENLLVREPGKAIGGISYGEYNNRIIGAKNGKSSDLEEMEFAYLHYYLTDDCILLWAAFGGTGMSRIDAIAQLSGAIIETPEIKTYAHIESVLGRLCVSPYLHQNYKALPPNA